MNDELPPNFRAVADFFGLVGTAPVIKDFYVVRAIGIIAALDTAPFTLVFGGGTALARAHQLVKRMSEDVDFKVVLSGAAPASKSQLRQQLGLLRDQVTAAFQAGGLAFDPTHPGRLRSRDANTYTVWQLPYGGGIEAGHGLRPTIQIELTYAQLRLPATALPVGSFVAEALGRPPEVTRIPCVSLVQTAAEKLVSLTRRIAMERAGVSRAPDPALVRHIYDLHAMRHHVDPTLVATLAHDVAVADAVEFKNQFPAYALDIAGETRRTLTAIQTEPAYLQRYNDFMAAMVYGERTEFAEAMHTVTALVKILNHQ